MALSTSVKLAILRANPHVLAVFDRCPLNDPNCYVLVKRNNGDHPLNLPALVPPKNVIIREVRPITDLRAPIAQADTTCYNEPVPGGVQIHPLGKNWVGTLGAACSFHDKDGNRRWGILSNWHVLCGGSAIAGHPIHQPTDLYPPLAHLSDWEPVSPDLINRFDAAVANANIQGLHTVAPTIRLSGRPAPAPVHPTPNLFVRKTGRTTDLTRAVCTATDACVKVSYGHFAADFCEQAIFEATDTPFSAPGDSGSLIITETALHPVALLFAGNDELTIGCPLKPIVDRFNLSFQFPE